jgi:hypothetical protein
MRTLWHWLGRVVFWSFERGTWPYDVAVVVIVAFVLLSPRAWFNDQPEVTPSVAVGQRNTGPAGELETYRIDARALSSAAGSSKSAMELELRDAVRKNSKRPGDHSFDIVRIAPVRDGDGVVAYDVSVRFRRGS